MSTFEQSPAERAVLLEKQQRKAALRAEYNKQISNPFRQALGEGGTVFDPALQRHQAMRISYYEHFRPTGSAFRSVLFTCVLPIVLYTWYMKADRDRRERKFRTGEVAYKDRNFKFI